MYPAAVPCHGRLTLAARGTTTIWSVTTATPAKPRTSRTPVLDSACAEAVELALAAAEDVAGIGNVGEHLGIQSDGERVATHFFEARERGYVGWRWAVTVTRASRSKLVTVDETVLVPGDGAIMPPQWLPWSERLQPGDIGVGDLLPTAPDDVRLEPGYTGADEPEIAVSKAAEEEVWERRDSLPLIAYEIGIGRPRVEPSFVPDVIDRMEVVEDAASIAAARVLSRHLGRRVGGSTGTNLVACARLATEMAQAGVRGSIVTILCDSGERYASTCFNDAWLAQRGLDLAAEEARMAAFLATGQY